MTEPHDIEFHLVGLSHRTASVALRERYAVQPDLLEAKLKSLLDSDGVSEACILSTCNRTEVLVAAAADCEPVKLIREGVFAGVAEDAIYTFRDVHAVFHLFRVASGLDSVVLGETEVLGQLKRAMEASAAAGAAKSRLRPLLTHALRVGKRVRSQTDLGLGTLSVARVGIDVARQVFGSFDRCDALVVGAGETGALVGRHLKDVGVRRLAFANRTLARAEELATQLGARAYALEELSLAVREADLVVACVEGEGGVIDPVHFDRKGIGRRDSPLLVVDLSVPRAVHDSVAKITNVLLYDLDDLQPVVEKNVEGRARAVHQSTPILVSEAHKFLSLRTFANFTPAINELRARFEEEREAVLDRLTNGQSSAREIELAHELTRRLLDIALIQMKEGARRTRSQKALDWEYQRFLEGL